ncbi:hypothetical protein DV096_05305 [Bradymonadaceae bacterium TMQ3]|nr:hypothetical protein DV096_05305 [Bradymonadaceae bacterium TMQ3]TXC77273.1 hypothetical protein FRC91_00635 [Bradymonadales bacterium TMQ1]
MSLHAFPRLPRAPHIYALAMSLSAALAFVACDAPADSQGASAPSDDVAVSEIPQATWAPPEPVDLRNPDALPMHPTEVGQPTLYPRCHELFEPEGSPRAWPLDHDEADATLFGCEPEAALTLSAPPMRLVAYSLPRPTDSRATDLRLVAYNDTGELLWQQRIDRQHQGDNFTANFRGSFLTHVDQKFVCAGTRWQGGTQALCAHQDSGEVIFDGTMNFWSGIDLVGVGPALVGADINGLTLRYPFTGVEMRHRAFGARGGRTAFYASSPTHVFFVPADGDPVLSAWNLETLEIDWQLTLPDKPQPNSGQSFPSLKLLVFKIGDTLHALSTTDGTQRITMTVGVDNPSLATTDDALLVLVRRSDAPPLLTSLDPRTGLATRAALAPRGALAVGTDGPRIFTRSVRALREITLKTPPPRANSDD